MTTPADPPSPTPAGGPAAPAPGQTWNLQRIQQSGAAFQTLIGTYVEGQASSKPPALESLSAHFWHLKPGDVDGQQAHLQDELYYVIKGAGVLTVDGKPHALAAGDLIFVPRDTPHTFHDFASPEGLSLLIFFAPNYTGRG